MAETVLANDLSGFDLLSLDPIGLSQLRSSAPANLEISLPRTASQSLDLQLVSVSPTTDDFVLTSINKKGETPEQYSPAMHYWGVIKGQPSSWVALTVFENEVMAVIQHPVEGTITLGLNPNGPEGEHILFRSEDELNQLPFSCGTMGTDMTPGQIRDLHNQAQNGSNSRVSKCVKIYFECEYNMYVEKGSVTNTANYVTGLFNVVSLLYALESIPVQISQITIWTSPDSYPTSSTSAALTSFRSTRPTYNGDLAHLLSRGAPTGGGIAYVDVLCSSYGYAYSYIYSTYSNYPTYSWTCMVVTHEIGHNLGSPHTQSCSWPGGALDNCYTTEGGCAAGPAPTNGGTIMSYCHLTSYGINLANGFGRLPGNLIRSEVQNASCLTTCSSLPPYNAVISLRAVANNMYVCADNYGNSDLIANRTAVGQWEKFDVINAGNGLVALRANANIKYVCAENGGGSNLIANRTAIGPWEQFIWIYNSDGTISLRAIANARLVCAENAGSQPLIANRTSIGPWEKFNYTIHGYFAKTSQPEGLAEAEIGIYPNPAGDHVYVTGASMDAQIEVYDLRGLRLMQLKGVNEIDISSLASGTYLLRVDQNRTLRFVKQ